MNIFCLKCSKVLLDPSLLDSSHYCPNCWLRALLDPNDNIINYHFYIKYRNLDYHISSSHIDGLTISQIIESSKYYNYDSLPFDDDILIFKGKFVPYENLIIKDVEVLIDRILKLKAFY